MTIPPLGAHWLGAATTFAVHSEPADAVELCLFDAGLDAGGGSSPATERRLSMEREGHTWWIEVEDVGPGARYGFRAKGPSGLDPAKLLVDPYARAIAGEVCWSHQLFAPGVDSAASVPRSVVTSSVFDWGDDRRPGTAWADTVAYELHVKGFTQRHPGVPEALRGSFAGLASDAALAHLRRLGVTAVSLLPVQQHLDERHLSKLGLSNYWGYNTVGFFCPEPRLGSGSGSGSGAQGASTRDEFRAMVRRLHAAGIEVILDVVYNHTAEGDEHGPTISFRGLDNAAYYRLLPEHRAQYENHTGCGNTLDLRHPRVLQLVLDSLRYWVGEMHVDGFRFDLASVLGRTDSGFDRHAAFFTAVAQDPLLCRVKMIAEPWDIGPGGYQLGGFPPGWLEWNDQFRDTLRSFWIEAKGTRGDFARRLCASSDIFQPQGRTPAESVNYVVSHDGFTLRDLLSFNARHNQANGEANRDGHGDNRSWNCGVEGPTDSAAVNALRQRLARALIATTLLSQGTPMLAAGDELGHTQGGNNNPYCQDNPTTWIDWSQADQNLIAFTERVLTLRRSALPLNDRWYDGLTDRLGLHDLSWLRADGSALGGADWDLSGSHVLGCLIGKPARARAPLLLLINAEAYDHAFMLPGGVWRALLDTSQPRGQASWHGQGGSPFPLPARSLVLLAAAGCDIE